MFDSVDDLTSAVTSVLSPNGPLGRLAHTLTTALDTVWAEFFGSPTPPGGTHWNAYSHEQLYGMLWQDADVGEVGSVAADWGKHSEALTSYAEALRREADALRANWQGRAAESAADRLADLSDRIWNAGARAGTVQKAAADAGDALATARNTMPKPTPDPMTLAASAVGAGPMNPIAAVLIGGARIFTADAVAGVSKAEAVRVMQRYESTLHSSSAQVVPSQAAGGYRSYQVDGLDGSTSAAGAGGGGATAVGAGPLGSGTGAGAGVPWSRLVGGAPGTGGGALEGGRFAGAAPNPVGSLLAAERAALAEAAARRGGAGGGFMGGPMAARPTTDDEKAHRTRLPNVDTGLFALDQRASDPVIGAIVEREPDLGL
ncbi:WXG100 family type VII secretion target [Actinokineospora bangkokensis]|uniref:hypothetical protein n=1 Tax=Actinokineospora bangkokensis TaxID=1193682 RepID=UPI00117842C1|nr:hypothetical protein [Actinokineospora bangkokensis]